MEEAVKKAEEFSDKEIYVIGGASIYEQMLKYCDTAYITYIDYSYAADAYFPNLDKDPEWELANEDEEFIRGLNRGIVTIGNVLKTGDCLWWITITTTL